MKEFLSWLPAIVMLVTASQMWQKLVSATERIDKAIDGLNAEAKKIPEIETTQKLHAQAHDHTRHTLTEHEKKTSGEFARLDRLVQDKMEKLVSSGHLIENKIAGLDARVKSLEEQKPVLRAIQALEETVVHRTTIVPTERKG